MEKTSPKLFSLWIYCVVLFLTDAGLGSNICTSRGASTCQQCLAVHPTCAWCFQEDFGQDVPGSSRCDLKKNLIEAGCRRGALEYPTSKMHVTENKDLSAKASGSTTDVTQIQPQSIHISLRPDDSTPPIFPEQEVEVAVPSAHQFVKRCRQTWKKARLKLLRASQQYQHQANRRRRPAPTLRPGQRVWLSTKNIPLRVESRKLSQRFIGPFRIARKVNPVTYQLYLPKSLKINPTFHVSLLKPVLSSPFLATGRPPPPRIIGGQPAYTVHRILDVHQVRGSRQYLVDWEGYGPEERSWVPAKDILDPKLVQEFYARKTSCPGGNVRSRS